MSLCVGLTGGIASGKSTVAQQFAALGVPVIDADQVARDVVEPGTAGLSELVAAFGTEYLDVEGRLDRRRLRRSVFADPAMRRQLESILHPRIRAGLREWRNALRAPYGILMAPILAEGGFAAICDRILVVDAAPELQIERLMQRDAIDRELAKQMLAAQSDRASRLAIADDVLDNGDSSDAIAAQVSALHARYCELAAQKLPESRQDSTI